MAFWVYESTVINLMVQIGILVIALLTANTIRRKVPFIKKSLLPTSVIGGLLILIINMIVFSITNQTIEENSFIDEKLMGVITYHTLALGFIAITLKKIGKNKSKKIVFFETGVVVVSTYMLQAALGLLVTIFLFSYFSGMIPGSGILLALGFGQGTGQALNFGTIFQTDHGFVGGADFGLSIAAIGFIVACLIGVIYLNILRKKGDIDLNKTRVKMISSEEINAPNDIPLTDSIDKFTIQVAIVLLVYFATFGIMYGVHYLMAGNPMQYTGDNPSIMSPEAKTVTGLVWGFNFLIGTVMAVIFKVGISKLKRHNIMKRDYPNSFLLNRISGFMFDFMIIAGISAINITKVQVLFVPLIIICLIGAVASFFYIKFVCKYLYPDYENEAVLSLFGTLTGTASTGMILLREADPNFETPAANNLIYQNLYAILLGAPLLALLALAPLGLIQSWISLIIIVCIFIIFNVIIFRRKFFKKKIS